MDDKTLQFLSAMAEKLGTTANHLWGVLVRQAPITAATEAVFYLVLFCALFFVAKVMLSTYRKWSAQEFRIEEWQGFVLVLVGLLFGACILAFGLSFGVDLPRIVAGFFNPEYWALQQILRLK